MSFVVTNNEINPIHTLNTVLNHIIMSIILISFQNFDVVNNNFSFLLYTIHSMMTYTKTN